MQKQVIRVKARSRHIADIVPLRLLPTPAPQPTPEIVDLIKYLADNVDEFNALAIVAVHHDYNVSTGYHTGQRSLSLIGGLHYVATAIAV